MQKVEETRSVRRRSIIERRAPLVLVRAERDVGRARVPTARPPAVLARVRDSLRVARVGACAELGPWNIRRLGEVDLFDPLLYFRRIDRGNTIEGRIVCGIQIRDCQTTQDGTVVSLGLCKSSLGC